MLICLIRLILYEIDKQQGHERAPKGLQRKEHTWETSTIVVVHTITKTRFFAETREQPEYIPAHALSKSNPWANAMCSLVKPLCHKVWSHMMPVLPVLPHDMETRHQGGQLCKYTTFKAQTTLLRPRLKPTNISRLAQDSIPLVHATPMLPRPGFQTYVRMHPLQGLLSHINIRVALAHSCHAVLLQARRLLITKTAQTL